MLVANEPDTVSTGLFGPSPSSSNDFNTIAVPLAGVSVTVKVVITSSSLTGSGVLSSSLSQDAVTNNNAIEA